MVFLTNTLINLYDVHSLYIKTKMKDHESSRKALTALEDALRYENGTLSPGLIPRQNFVFDAAICQEKELIKKKLLSRFFCDLGSIFTKSSATYPTQENSTNTLNSLKDLEKILSKNKEVEALQTHKNDLEALSKEISKLHMNAHSILHPPSTKEIASLEVQKETLTGVAITIAGVATIFFSIGHLSYYLKK